MKGLNRSLIYWGWMLEKMMLTLIAGILCYLVVIAFISGGFDEKKVMEMMPQFLCMLICISAFMNVLNGVNTYFPLAVSLGSTRKASYVAMQIIQHLIMFEYLILGAVVYFLTQQEAFPVLTEYALTIIGAVFLLLALANLAGLVSARFGRTAGVITYLCIFVAILAVILVGVISGKLDDLMFLDTLGDFASKPYLLILGILLDGVVIGSYYTVMKKQDLQF